MKIGKAKIGDYVAANHLTDSPVYQVVSIDGPILEVTEIVNGKDTGYVHHFYDCCIYIKALKSQLKNAGLLN